MSITAIQVDFLIAGMRDSSGNPLSDGTATFYDTDGVTLKTIWEDAEKDDTAANPFPLSEGGTATIYADGFYMVTIKDSDGDVIYTSPSPFSFLPDDSGDDVIIATDYGSTKNDTTIAAAITAAASADRTVYLSPGEWEINNNLLIPSNINLRLEMGAYLTIASTKTVTYTGVIEGIPDYNHHRGAGTVTFSAKNYFVPSRWQISGTTGNVGLTGVWTLTGQWNIDNLRMDGNTLSSTSGALNIIPVTGSAAVIDSHFSFDGTVLTAITDSNTTITAFAGRNITIEGTTFDGGVVAGISSLTATAITGTLQTAAQTNITSIGTLTSLSISGNLSVDSPTFIVDSTNNRVGIGTASPSFQLDIASSGTSAILRLENDGAATPFRIRDTSNGDVVYIAHTRAPLSAQIYTTGGVTLTLGANGVTNHISIATSGVVTIANTLNVTGSTVLSNTLSVASDFAINTNKFTITSSNGNTAIAGNLTVVSDFQVNTNKFTVTASNGNTLVAGTLSATSDFAINTNKFNVTASNGNTAIAGTLSAVGDFAINSNKFNVTASNGNTLVAGTLGVTGVTTLGTLAVTNVSSDFAINTNKFNVTASNGNTLVAGTLGVTGNATFTGSVFTVDWTDYSATSTIVGFSAFSTKAITYMKLGKIVYVDFLLVGTSNSTSTSFTLPYTSQENFDITHVYLASDNGGAYVAGSMSISSGSAIWNLYPTVALTGNWTNSGTKSVSGHFWYRTS